ncbi:MAG TPA: bifunctional 4-hydroxy-2-oxoglutarate aldolase/2-dehydro-3-deoxy-phosphogluconate aldolase [Chryseosolibacter sp.]|nr:bifunctional 4-hydroxy-2-oxoglutarate aldolase/2-dehydro-3-deoxy-phosphogluconate aldolase [Chryseosolibacter sp.]
MKYHSRHGLVDAMETSGIIPVFNHPDKDVAAQIVDAMYRGGLRVFEFTNRSANAMEVFTHLLDHVSKYPDIILGIGTVLDEFVTREFIDAGAHFIVSPVLKVSMAPACDRANILWIPGCATPTEVLAAREAGALMVKIFPGSALGPSFVSSVRSVIPNMRYMITGGVEPDANNLNSWFAAGASCVGMGSQLLTREILTTRSWHVLEQNVTSLLMLLHDIRHQANSITTTKQ